jgi:hypothetical protein
VVVIRRERNELRDNSSRGRVASLFIVEMIYFLLSVYLVPKYCRVFLFCYSLLIFIVLIFHHHRPVLEGLMATLTSTIKMQ